MSGEGSFRRTWFLAGIGVSTVVTGSLLGALGDLVYEVPVKVSLIVVPLAVAMCIADVAGTRAFTFPRRQTYSGARTYLPPAAAAWVWGLDIGLGISTFRTTRLYWVGCLLALGTHEPMFCLVATGTYGLSLAFRLRTRSAVIIDVAGVLGVRRRLGLAGVAVLITVGALAW